MPIYEYECKSCGHIISVFQYITMKADEINCSKCGKTAKKIISKTTFHLKGKGWAADNYSSTKD